MNDGDDNVIAVDIVYDAIKVRTELRPWFIMANTLFWKTSL